MTDLETAPSHSSAQEVMNEFIDSHRLSTQLRFDDGSLYMRPIAKSNGNNNSKTTEVDDDILYSESPLIVAPPFEFLKLINLGKCCCVCGETFKFLHKRRASDADSKQKNKQNSILMASRYLDGLDCDKCSHKWCNAECKRLDIFHSMLNHIPGNSSMTNSIVSLENSKKIIVKFAIYSDLKKKVSLDNCDLGFYAFISILRMVYDERIIERFDCLPVSILKLDDDEVMDEMTMEKTLLNFLDKQFETQIDWKEYYSLICKSFKEPNLEAHPLLKLSFCKFLKIMVQFKLKSIYGEGNLLFFMSSFLDHSCEPNCKVSFASDGFTLDDDIDTDYKMEAVADNSIVFVKSHSTSTSEDIKNNTKTHKSTKENASKHTQKTKKEWSSKANGVKIHRLPKVDSKTVGKDDKITINYLQNAPSDVFQRREELMNLYNIDCHCRRCERELQLFKDRKQHQQCDFDSNASVISNDSVSITSTSPQLRQFLQPRRVSIDPALIKKPLSVSPTTTSTTTGNHIKSMHSSMHSQKSHQKRPSFTSSGGSFGEGILKYNRRQIKEMLDNISENQGRNQNDEDLFLDSSDDDDDDDDDDDGDDVGDDDNDGDDDYDDDDNNDNDNKAEKNMKENGKYDDDAIEDDDDECSVRLAPLVLNDDQKTGGASVIQLTVPSGFNLSGRRKSVRFDDNLSINE